MGHAIVSVIGRSCRPRSVPASLRRAARTLAPQWLQILPRDRAMTATRAPKSPPRRHADGLRPSDRAGATSATASTRPRRCSRHRSRRASCANRDARITAAQIETLSGHAMQELDDEALGWFSRRLPWGSYGMLCRASLTSPDLGVAIKRWCRHHRLLTDDMRAEARGGRWRRHACRSRSGAKLGRVCASSAWSRSLRFLHGYACWADRFAHVAARGDLSLRARRRIATPIR